MADAEDLKSFGLWPCGFKSRLRHHVGAKSALLTSGSPLQGPRFFASLPCSSFSAKACGLWRGGTGVKQSPLCSQAGVPCRVPLFCIAPLLLLVRQTLKALADKETGNKECLFFTAAIAAGAGGNTFTSPFSCRRLPKSAPGKAGRSVSPLAGNFGQRLQLPLRPCQISRPQKTCPPGH